MNATWPDLTTKIVEPVHQRALRMVARIAATVGVDWFLMGAMARDWVFTHIHGIDTQRATKDADIGIALKSWEEFEQIRNGLLAEGEFAQDRIPHRLNHCQLQGFHIDLVPFGALAGDKAEIAWPPKCYEVMNVIGFDEAFRAALTVIVDTDLPVKVASPIGLMLLKLFAWEDRKRESAQDKDARDIRLLLTHYEVMAGRTRWDVTGLMEAEDFHDDRAVARLLGSDVAQIASPETKAALMTILDRELPGDEIGLLVQQMTRNGSALTYFEEGAFETMRRLLESFRAGLRD